MTAIVGASNRKRLKAAAVDLPPTFHPWIGSQAAGRLADLAENPILGDDFSRWHVLGESHYVRPDDPGGYVVDADLTTNIVKDWALQRSKGSAFFSRVASIVAEASPDQVDLEPAWSRIAYSNFVQSALPGPRQAPSREQWEQARRCFFGQLALTRPNVLVVLGARQWDQLPMEGCVRLPELHWDAGPDWPLVNDAWLYVYRTGEQLNATIAVKVVHPSAGFGRWNWLTASRRAHTAHLFFSNMVEWSKDHYEIV